MCVRQAATNTAQPDCLAAHFATHPPPLPACPQVVPDSSAKKGTAKADDAAEEATGSGADGGAVLSELQLSDWVRLDTCVTVVDASLFLDNLHSIEELRDRWEGQAL